MGKSRSRQGKGNNTGGGAAGSTKSACLGPFPSTEEYNTEAGGERETNGVKPNPPLASREEIALEAGIREIIQARGQLGLRNPLPRVLFHQLRNILQNTGG